MNETEWLSSSDPEAMLKVVLADASDRQLRLFACACARCFWEHLDHPRSRQAIETTERYADGLATDNEHRIASDAARAVARSLRLVTTGDWGGALGWSYLGRVVARDVSHRKIKGSILQALRTILHAAYVDASSHTVGAPRGQWSIRALQEQLCLYLRDVFANSFLAIGPLDAALLARNDRAVLRVAETLYEEADFARLPILADALEDAGCSDAAILDHCRGKGPHVRGCWVVDLILGKS